jgi:hypothetical protein
MYLKICQCQDCANYFIANDSSAHRKFAFNDVDSFIFVFEITHP